MELTRSELQIIRTALELNVSVLSQANLSTEYVEIAIDKVDKLLDYCGSCESIGIK